MNGIKFMRWTAAMIIPPSLLLGLCAIAFGVKFDQPAFIPIGLVPIVLSLVLVDILWRARRVFKPLKPKQPSASDDDCGDSVPGGWDDEDD